MIKKIISIVLSNKVEQTGQTLIEVLAALGAAVVVVTAVVIAVVGALSNAQFSKNQNLATQYAQEAMEVVRAQRNSDYLSFSSLTTDTYCLDKGKTNLATASAMGCGQNVDVFVREIDIEKNSPSCGLTAAKVSAYVSWSDSKCTDPTEIFCHQVHLDSCLSNFNVVPTP